MKNDCKSIDKWTDKFEARWARYHQPSNASNQLTRQWPVKWKIKIKNEKKIMKTKQNKIGYWREGKRREEEKEYSTKYPQWQKFNDATKINAE